MWWVDPVWFGKRRQLLCFSFFLSQEENFCLW
jgi:hypothetical protein